MRSTISAQEEETQHAREGHVFALGCITSYPNRANIIFTMPIIENAGESYFVVSQDLSWVRQYERAIRESIDISGIDFEIRSIPTDALRIMNHDISAAYQAQLIDMRDFYWALRDTDCDVLEHDHTYTFEFFNDANEIQRVYSGSNTEQSILLRPVLYGDSSGLPNMVNNQVIRTVSMLPKIPVSNDDPMVFLPFLRHSTHDNDFTNLVIGPFEQYAKADLLPQLHMQGRPEYALIISPKSLTLTLRLLGTDKTRYISVDEQMLRENADKPVTLFDLLKEYLSSVPSNDRKMMVFPAFDHNRQFIVMNSEGTQLTPEDIDFSHIIPCVLVLPALQSDERTAQEQWF